MLINTNNNSVNRGEKYIASPLLKFPLNTSTEQLGDKEQVKFYRAYYTALEWTPGKNVRESNAT